MKKTARFVIQICSKFTREQIEEIIKGLSDVLADCNPDVKPKDDFKEKHPHYRNFFVDPNPPLKAPPKTTPKLDWRKLLSIYEEKRGHPLKPVNTKNPKAKVPKDSTSARQPFVVIKRRAMCATRRSGSERSACKY